MSLPSLEPAAAEGVEVVTFGCRLNGVESDRMRRAAEAAGHRSLTIVNTCAVTSEASRQARQTIRRLKRERPERTIVATGCAAEIERDSFSAMDEISALIGNADKNSARVWQQLPGAAPQAAMPADRPERHTRAFVEIQNGCDHRCTFCIIPFGRGASRSIEPERLIDEISRYVQSGRREIVLTGVDVTAYGRDLQAAPSLGGLVQQILRRVPDLERLRLSSIDCIEADEALLDVIGEERRFMPHLHLSLQAGDDLILKRMKRRHSRADAIDFCLRLRQLQPEITFGADLITGFPTETEAMFQRTLDLVAECGLTYLHVFPFSVRPGTAAARMPQVSGDIARERAARLRETGERALAAHLDSKIGRVLRVLAEQGGTGHSEDFSRVRTEGIEPGKLVELFITGHDGRVLSGEPVPLR